MNIQGWFPLGLTGLISLKSKGLFQHHNSKASSLWRSAFFMVQLSHLCMTTGKNHSFDYTDLCQRSLCFLRHLKSLCLCFLIHCLGGLGFVIAFLPRSKCLNFMAAVIVRSDFGAQENKICHCFHFFPFYLPWSDRADPIMLVFWVLSFKLVFSLSFSPSSRGSLVSLCFAIRVISTEYLRLLNGMQK